MKNTSNDKELHSQKRIAGSSFAAKIQFSWTCKNPNGIEIDFSAVVENKSGESDFIYYGNTSTPCGSIRVEGYGTEKNGKKKESMLTRLNDSKSNIERVYFIASIHNDEGEGASKNDFNMVEPIGFDLLDSDDSVIISHSFSKDLSAKTAIVVAMAEMVDGKWSYMASGKTYEGGLISALKEFGLA